MIQKKVMGHITEQSPHRYNQLHTLNYINKEGNPELEGVQKNMRERETDRERE